jgi:hypothetical protein
MTERAFIRAKRRILPKGLRVPVNKRRQRQIRICLDRRGTLESPDPGLTRTLFIG